MYKQTSYGAIRDSLQPGDIVAFGGRGLFSKIIKIATGYPASHIGIVMETKLAIEGEAQPGRIVWLLESTTLYKNKDTGKDERGVFERRMSTRVDEYNGEIWVLPLAADIRAEIDWKRFFDLAVAEKGKGYDMAGAILSAGILPIPSFWNKSVFCSNLAVWLLKSAGLKRLAKVLPEAVNPRELVRMKLYQDDYFQIKGKSKELGGFNTRCPWLSNFAG